MSTITKEWLLKTIAELEEERDATSGAVNEDAAMALAAMKLALASLEAKDKIPELRQVIYHFRDWNEGFPVERFKADYVISWMLANYPPAQPTAVSVPGDVSGPLAHAYKELTPTFMRNHIDVFERYGIYPDGSSGIQAMRIALDGMNRRAAMLQGADGNAPAHFRSRPAQSSLSPAQGGNSPVIPEGWVMVPIEPTADMREAYHQAQAEYEDVDGLWSPDHQWQAMLAAAPKQEAK
ncbi:hypothetical protein [Enterobacter hormaechei]|uniref:hypothetical protein n=1 Tax=Enterobacter hormaechei TaxID=158836 RepID=UPI001BD04CD8|nr:hypothetical protein [Enterobacter hormaechei]EHN8733903.1 hypothetical protein [Enterobacter hormaechei]WLZ57117.1 hypothetical protein QPR82_11935 [Enterobacter hormaechei]WLZ61922.1 hypothetical protein QPR66_11935 [Enterobacter hormaechei]